ncbi:MAG: pteridine reductase, partial [Candidatus Omnitrophota bacterium]
AKRIGKEIALALAKDGYNIALHYNTSHRKVETLAKSIRKLGRQCETFPCDLSDPEDSLRLLNTVKKTFKNISLLVNNASLFKNDSVKRINLKLMQDHLNIHLISPYVLTSEFNKKFKNGHIINILDRHVTQNNTQFTSYLLSKKALQSLTEISAIELAPKIRVNAIAPGLILPPENETKTHLLKRIKNVPLKSIGNPKQIAQTVLFLDHNPYITGQTIYVDGGEHLV